MLFNNFSVEAFVLYFMKFSAWGKIEVSLKLLSIKLRSHLVISFIREFLTPTTSLAIILTYFI